MAKAIEAQATKELGKPVQIGIGEIPAFPTSLYKTTDLSSVMNYTHWHSTFDDYDVIADLFQTKDNQIMLAVSWADQAETHPILKTGSKGAGVKIIQGKLIEYGYMAGDPSGNFDKNTVKAIKDFQINNGLNETGTCDDVLWNKLLDGYVRRQETVYKSKKGKVYHSRSNCSNMKTATSMTLSEALRKGLSACSHCH